MTFNSKIKNNQWEYFCIKFVIISKTIDHWKPALLSRVKRNEDDGRCEIRNHQQKSEIGRSRCCRKSYRNFRPHCRYCIEKNKITISYCSICFMFSRNCINKIQLNQKLYLTFFKDVWNFSLMFNLFWNI